MSFSCLLSFKRYISVSRLVSTCVLTCFNVGLHFIKLSKFTTNKYFDTACKYCSLTLMLYKFV